MINSIARRSCAILLLAMLFAGHPNKVLAAVDQRPTLATEDQLAAERLALKMITDPKVKAIRASVRATLASDPAAATAEGKATLDRALDLWTMSLLMQEFTIEDDHPHILWVTDDTPHQWFGIDFPGMGIAGDNPDNIYRGTSVDGAHHYEIRGHVPPNGPAQFNFELVRGTPGKLVMKTLDKHNVDMGNQLKMLNDRDMKIGSDGNFVVTIGPDPAEGRPNYLQTEPGSLVVALRNSFSDWRQTPVAMTITRLDPEKSHSPQTEAEVADRFVADLPGWVAGWSKLKEGWLGNPAPNKLRGPVARDGGWGFGAGGRFDLKDDEAIVMTTTAGGARYTGFQALDRWFMEPDSRKDFTSRNNAQVAANADGSVTYVISLKDPGVFNWISTGGYHQGYLNVRWQQVPAGTTAAQLVRSYKLIKLADLKSELPPGTRWVTAADRTQELHQRAVDYESRLFH